MTSPCPACRSDRVRPAFRTRGADYLRCGTCATLFTEEPLSPGRLADLYSGPSYFVKGATDGSPNGYTGDYLGDEAFITAKFRDVLGHLERYAPRGRLIDVGCGPGFLVAAAAGRGWDAQGIDLNEWAVSYGRDRLGLDLHHGELTDLGLDDASIDAVTLMDVLEHVPDPSALLDEVARVLRPGGVVAVLTPDAGALMSRVAGRRWPEVRLPGEHPILYSRGGLSSLLAAHRLVATGWHPSGKTATVGTLLADVASAAPTLSRAVRRVVAGRSLERRVIELDPRTKVCMYARRLPDTARPHRSRPGRVPKRPEALAEVDDAVVEELQHLERATRYSRWLYSAYDDLVPGARVLEVGGGIGTFTQLMMASGATEVVVIEPDARCAKHLEARVGGDHRVEVLREPLPDAPSLRARAATFDLVVCQNVLEHIAADDDAVAAMAAALRPGGHLALMVPAGPRLFGALDDAYGHWRRYDAAGVTALVRASGLEVESLRAMNLLGVPAWWVKNRRPGARVRSAEIQVNDVLLAAWRPVEERLHPNLGLTLACLARRPADDR